MTTNQVAPTTTSTTTTPTSADTAGAPAGTRAQSPLPRPLIRTFWAVHRFLHRASGGRFGLAQPQTGSKMGMLRLATIGRRTGRPRIAIVGYFADGENLVTLAMNGWGEAEPAWWLNLQAHPDATVALADGTRAVRARAATGEERDRLWATFRDYPGWGDDITALAANRPGETAVVILEPRRETTASAATASSASAATASAGTEAGAS